tara:strand:+ start:696 stop:1073 length:378 start_codon:yes stop_codon:yes gene_type:complete
MPNFQRHHYRPLPECVTVRNSDTHIGGSGLYATENIPGGSRIGITHLILNEEDTKLMKYDTMRTPLGAFINHADEPNSVLILHGRLRVLVTARPIPKDTEITIYYTMGYDDILPNYGGPKAWCSL